MRILIHLSQSHLQDEPVDVGVAGDAEGDVLGQLQLGRVLRPRVDDLLVARQAARVQRALQVVVPREEGNFRILHAPRHSTTSHTLGKREPLARQVRKLSLNFMKSLDSSRRSSHDFTNPTRPNSGWVRLRIWGTHCLRRRTAAEIEGFAKMKESFRLSDLQILFT